MSEGMASFNSRIDKGTKKKCCNLRMYMAAAAAIIWGFKTQRESTSLFKLAQSHSILLKRLDDQVGHIDKEKREIAK